MLAAVRNCQRFMYLRVPTITQDEEKLDPIMAMHLMHVRIIDSRKTASIGRTKTPMILGFRIFKIMVSCE